MTNIIPASIVFLIILSALIALLSVGTLYLLKNLRLERLRAKDFEKRPKAIYQNRD